MPPKSEELDGGIFFVMNHSAHGDCHRGRNLVGSVNKDLVIGVKLLLQKLLYTILKSDSFISTLNRTLAFNLSSILIDL